MALLCQPGAEPIAGYQLIQRLGSGGYGEVWKATAPGGLTKAIKIVYGHMHDARAEQELKALGRIKEVRHPFILSLERLRLLTINSSSSWNWRIPASWTTSRSAGAPGCPVFRAASS
jgi:hypothetical protein